MRYFLLLALTLVACAPEPQANGCPLDYHPTTVELDGTVLLERQALDLVDMGVAACALDEALVLRLGSGASGFIELHIDEGVDVVDPWPYDGVELLGTLDIEGDRVTGVEVLVDGRVLEADVQVLW